MLPGCIGSLLLVHLNSWSVALGQRLLPHLGQTIIFVAVIGIPYFVLTPSKHLWQLLQFIVFLKYYLQFFLHQNYLCSDNLHVCIWPALLDVVACHYILRNQHYYITQWYCILAFLYDKAIFFLLVDVFVKQWCVFGLQQNFICLIFWNRRLYSLLIRQFSTICLQLFVLLAECSGR